MSNSLSIMRSSLSIMSYLSMQTRPLRHVTMLQCRWMSNGRTGAALAMRQRRTALLAPSTIIEKGRKQVMEPPTAFQRVMNIDLLLCFSLSFERADMTPGAAPAQLILR